MLALLLPGISAAFAEPSRAPLWRRLEQQASTASCESGTLDEHSAAEFGRYLLLHDVTLLPCMSNPQQVACKNAVGVRHEKVGAVRAMRSEMQKCRMTWFPIAGNLNRQPNSRLKALLYRK